MTEDTGHASWRVESQTPRTRATATGSVEDGYDIAYVTGRGHAGTIFVPGSRYTTDNVRALIQAAADQVDAVGSLTSEG